MSVCTGPLACVVIHRGSVLVDPADGTEVEGNSYTGRVLAAWAAGDPAVEETYRLLGYDVPVFPTAGDVIRWAEGDAGDGEAALAFPDFAEASEGPVQAASVRVRGWVEGGCFDQTMLEYRLVAERGFELSGDDVQVALSQGIRAVARVVGVSVFAGDSQEDILERVREVRVPAVG